LDQYDIMIFIDGSIEITSADFVKFCIDSLGDNSMALYQHPQRDCIFDEAVASMPLIKYQSQNISGQISFYNSLYPKHGGLYACGVMVRKIQSPAIRDLMGKWWWEIIKWTYQDQLSFPVVCKLQKFIPGIIPGNQYKNPFFKVHWHDDKLITAKYSMS
ncbi:MAG: glycosyltransferase domain-containing protein, partial [Bacteroidales bacterium]